MLPVNQNYSEPSLSGWDRRPQDTFEAESYETQLQWIETSLRYVNDAVILINTSDQVILLNPAAEKITGLRFQEARFLPISEVFTLTHESPEDAFPSTIKALQTHSFPHLNLTQGLLKTRNNTYACSVEYTISSIL